MIAKFRGWTIETNREVKGYYCVVQGKHYIIPEDAELGRLDPDTTGSWDYAIGGFVEVHRKTVGQFTGREDKNKKEIYGSIPINGKMSKGGDIVKQKLENYLTRTGRVDFHDGAFRVVGSDGTYDYLHNLTRFVSEYAIEIIGNVADNPEFLEK